jgi:hypothetical protein
MHLVDFILFLIICSVYGKIKLHSKCAILYSESDYIIPIISYIIHTSIYGLIIFYASHRITILLQAEGPENIAATATYYAAPCSCNGDQKNGLRTINSILMDDKESNPNTHLFTLGFR